MIIRKILIVQKILDTNKEYNYVEYESRRVVKRKNFEKREEKLKQVLDSTLNILKEGCWRWLQVGKEKKKVWLPSGEEVLRSSGLLDWEEELAHLQNQLTSEQPGMCAGLDTKQLKKDTRKRKTA